MPQVSLSDLKFRKSAASDLKKAAASDDASAFQKKVLKHWGDLYPPAFSNLPDHRFSATIGTAILLAAGDSKLFNSASQVAAAPNKAAEKKGIDAVIAAVAAAAADGGISTEFSMLLAMELVAGFGARFSAGQFRDTVLAIASFDPESGAQGNGHPDVSEILSDDAVAESGQGPEVQMVRMIVRFAEIPYRRSVLFDFLEETAASQKAAIETVAQAIEASTDTDGTVHTRLAKNPASWLAPFIRISSLAAATGNEWARVKTMKRWVASLEFFAALSIHQGWLNGIAADEVVASAGESGTTTATTAESELLPVHFLSSALAALQWKEKTFGRKGKKSKQDPLKDSSIPDVVAALLKTKGRAKRKPGPEMDWYNPSTQSDWAATALLRTGYEVDANSVLIDWDCPEIRVAISSLGSAVAGGDWGADILINGQEVPSVGDWTCTCWFQDDDVAFAELERGSANETRHVRHVMLHLQDHFALLTESVVAANADDQVVLRTSLPVASGVQVAAASVTRELFLTTEGPTCRVIPAWLPDDRIDSTDGDCRVENGALKSAAVGQGGVFMPLLIDWAPKNAKREADWTKLTITEDGEILNSYKAAAVRTRIGRQQLMLYRSIRPGDTLRAVIGHHTANETVYAKFTNDGEIEPLVMVEPNAEGE